MKVYNKFDGKRDGNAKNNNERGEFSPGNMAKYYGQLIQDHSDIFRRSLPAGLKLPT